MGSIKTKFINYKDDKYLYTGDNWKTVFITPDKNPPAGYKKEENKNRIFEAKLRYEFGIKPANKIIKELKKIATLRESLTPEVFNKNAGYGDEFEVFCISVLHGISYEETINCYVVNGNYDGTIDAIYKDESEKKCTIYQIKETYLGDDAIQNMKKNINFYIKGKLREVPNVKHLKDFLDKNIPNIADYSKTYKTISATGKLDSNILSSSVFVKYLSDKVLLSPSEKKLKLHLESSTSDVKTYAALDDERVIFFFARASVLIQDLINCFGENKIDDAFSNNVRGYEGDDDEMKKTIDKKPQLFCSFNNGVSITGECHIDKDEDNHFVIIEKASIINGQQTIYNLYSCYKQGNDLKNIMLPVFIKKYSNDKEQSLIAKYNNTQKNVSRIDLLSLEPNIRKIQRELISPKEKENDDVYYLNIISSGEKGIIKNAKDIFGRNRIIKLADFVKVFSVIRTPDSLGSWKNSLNEQIKEHYNDCFPSCSINEARRICSCIAVSKGIIKSNRAEYAIADLAIQYLLYLGIDQESVKEIIQKVTAKYSPRHKKKADIYKSKKAMSYVMGFVPKKYKISN